MPDEASRQPESTFKKPAEEARQRLLELKKAMPLLDNGWMKPPRVLPRPGELAQGVFYDPDRNTY
jgi:hypothetical protein